MVLLSSISPLSSWTSAASHEVPPPLRFRAPSGPIRNVSIDFIPRLPSLPSLGETVAQRNGIRYEGGVQNFLHKKSRTYWSHPSIRYVDDRGSHLAIPDGIFFIPKAIIVVEIKIRHMPEAWWQLKRLYEPVLRMRYPRVHCLEVVREYDCSMPFPCVVELIEDLDSCLNNPGNGFMVFQWRE